MHVERADERGSGGGQLQSVHSKSPQGATALAIEVLTVTRKKWALLENKKCLPEFNNT